MSDYGISTSTKPRTLFKEKKLLPIQKTRKRTSVQKLFLVALLVWSPFTFFLLRYMWFMNDLLYHDPHELESQDHRAPIPITEFTNTTALDKLIEDTDSSSSLNLVLTLLKQQKETNSHFDKDHIDPVTETARCAKYGYEYKGRTSRRRIFYGSPIADDSWHAIAIHAIEAYDLYHTVAFSESDISTADRTSHTKPRTLRFPPGSLNLEVMESGIFGPATNVYVDQYVDDPDQRKSPDGFVIPHQEDLQRDISLKRFIQNGMTKDDIAIFSDVDETFTRDFLLAAQICEIPQFVPGQTCHRPKIVSKTIIFEAAPDCITSNRAWFHPDMVLGECVDEIGDSSVHKPAKRLFSDRGRRMPGYEENVKENDGGMPNITMYPLWRPVDFRTVAGGDLHSDMDKLHIGFHFRNFFPSIEVMRNKFATYTHGSEKAWTIPIGEIHQDLNMTVNCMKGIPDEANAETIALKGGFAALKGAIPVAFQDGNYRQKRFQEVKEMILEDEKKVKEKSGIV